MTSPTRQLVSYANSLQFDDIPPSVVERLRLHLLDASGCAILGSEMEWTQMIASVLGRQGGAAEATVWNSSSRFPVAHAAFVNSVATHAFELDDRRVASYMHPASATLPAGLAVAESLGSVSGKDLVTAIVAGYEVGLRVGKCIGRGAWERGFYSPGLGGAFAAAATAGRLMGIGDEAMVHAFSLAATQTSGLYSPTMIKRFNLGRGTYNGLLAVQLAEAGYTGVEDAFEAEIGGLVKAYVDNPDLDLLTSGLGGEFETGKVELKPYVSSRPNHTSIDCILELRSLHPEITFESVKNIAIETSTANYRFGAGFEVQSVPAALMSVGYCVAVAFIDGDAFLPQFTDARVHEADVQDLLARTQVEANRQFDDMGLEMRDMTRVRCTLADGRVFEAEKAFAKGHPTDPLSEGEVITKFHRLVDSRIGQSRADDLQRLFLDIAGLDDVSRIARALQVQTALDA